MESIVTFRDALEPWNICPFQAWVDKSLSTVVVSWRKFVQRVTHCDRLCGTSGAIDLITARLSDLMGISSVKRHTHILSSHVSLGYDTTNEPTFSRRPSWGASTVINSALMPRFSACCTMRFVIARSLLTYLQSLRPKLVKSQSNCARTTGRIALDLVERHRLFRQRNTKIEWVSRSTRYQRKVESNA